jgi:hypothetical protein
VDNSITGKGKFSTANLPARSKAGGGTFDVPFDGQKITWQVRSLDCGKYVTLTAYASSSSSRCSGSSILGADSKGLDANAGANSDSLSGLDPERIKSFSEVISIEPVAYPNPATDKVTIEMSELSAASKVSIMDLSGRQFTVEKIAQHDHHLELDLSRLPAGIYIVSVYGETYHRQFRIVRIKK